MSIKIKLVFIYVAAMMIAACGGSNEEVTLRLSPEEGKVYNTDMQMNMEMGMMGMTTNMNMDFGLNMDIKEVSGDTIAVESAYKSIKVKQEMPMMGTIEYDSKNPEATTGMAAKAFRETFDPLLNTTFTMKFNRQGKVIDVIKNGPTAGMGNILSEQTDMQQYMDNIIAIFPTEPVKEGSTWSRKTDAKGQIPMIMNNTYTVKEIDKNDVTIELKGTMDLKEDAPQEMGTFEGNFNGTIVVDRATGWTKSAEMKQVMKMEMDQMGQKIPVTLNANVNFSSK